MGENKISLSQTSKGLWYCSDVTLYCYDLFDGVELLSGVVDCIETLCDEKNHKKDDQVLEESKQL